MVFMYTEDMNTNNMPLYGKLASLYYDTKEQYAKPDEVAFYASFIQPGHKVLEAMSGSGRLQIPLLQKGYHVEGVDNSPHMLARCRQRSAQLDLRPHLHEQAIQTMSLDKQYHVCIITMGSFQLIADRIQALQTLQTLRAHMHEGGILLLDLFVPSDTVDGTRSFDVAYVDTHTSIMFSTRYAFDNRHKRVDVFCTYELIVDGHVRESEHELMQFVWYEDHELAQLLEQAGFALVFIHEKYFRPAGVSRIVQARAL
jgi:SAM-dependent methyltransferase